MREPHPKHTKVLQIGSPETFPKPFLQYNQYLEPQNTQFSKEEKNQLLKKIQNLENNYQTCLSSLQLVLLYL